MTELKWMKADAPPLRAAIETWERDFFANPRGWK